MIRFLLDRWFPIPSPAVLGKIGRDYVNQINDYIVRNQIPTVKFVKGDVKEEIAREHFQQAEREDRYGVVMVGVVQERTSFTAEDRKRGYSYDLAFRQLEISDTRTFDRPAAGRAWFEKTIPDQLTLGRPDQVAIVFGRRVTKQTPGPFQTKVFNTGVEAAIQVHYRASKVKQYFKEGRALRTETTINDTHDFGIKRRVTPENWDALTAIGHQINDRLLQSQLDACQCAPDATALERVVLPSTHDGLPAPGLRFGEPRTMALLACLCCHTHLFAGLTNKSLRELIAGLIPGYNARQMTYDLRRLRRKGFIQRIPRTQRYELTSERRRLAVFFTKTYTRILNPSLAELDPQLPAEIANRSPLAKAWRAFENAVDDRVAAANLTG